MAAVPAWLLFKEGAEVAILVQMHLEATRDQRMPWGRTLAHPGKSHGQKRRQQSPHFFRLVSLFLATFSAVDPLEAFLGIIFSGSFFPTKPWAL